MADLAYLEARVAGILQLPPPAVCRLLREAAGLTQDDIAIAVGVNRETVARWELGTRAPEELNRKNYREVLDFLMGRMGWG